MAVFWDVAPCSLIEIDRRFGGAVVRAMRVIRVMRQFASLNVGQFLLDNTAQRSRR